MPDKDTTTAVVEPSAEETKPEKATKKEPTPLESASSFAAKADREATKAEAAVADLHRAEAEKEDEESRKKTRQAKRELALEATEEHAARAVEERKATEAAVAEGDVEAARTHAASARLAAELAGRSARALERHAKEASG